MGRGRAKAKQTKVARELKYSSGGTDLDALRKELAGGSTAPVGPTATADDADDDVLSAYEDEDDDEDDELGGSYGASGAR
jgi:hypothetical protein